MLLPSQIFTAIISRDHIITYWITCYLLHVTWSGFLALTFLLSRWTACLLPNAIGVSDLPMAITRAFTATFVSRDSSSLFACTIDQLCMHLVCLFISCVILLWAGARRVKRIYLVIKWLT